MITENFFGHDVNIGELRQEQIGSLYSFIKENGSNYEEMKNFVNLTKDKKCLLDVGCAFCDFALAFCTSEDKVAYAFDAAHSTQLAAMQNIIINPKKKIYYNKMFLGDKDAITPYYSDSDNALAVSGNDKVVMIQMDSFCALTEIQPDAIKIDTEGFEYNILVGGKTVIMNYRPLMFIELHPAFCKMYGTNIENIIDISKLLNYTIKDVNGNDITLQQLKELKEESIRTVWYPN